jgi:hypothetical protein
MDLSKARLAYDNGDAVTAYQSLVYVYEKDPKSLTQNDQLILNHVSNNLGQDQFLLNFLEDTFGKNKSILWLSKIYRHYKKINFLNDINKVKLINQIEEIDEKKLNKNEKYMYAMLNFLLGRKYKEVYAEAINNIEINKKTIDKKRFDPAIALTSTLELIEELKIRIDQQPFLIGGTLLGMIREGRLLGHDKDTDIGIHEIENINYFKIASDIALKTRFKTPQLFSTFYENRSKVITFFDSVHKVTIDLFIFKNNEENTYQELSLLGGDIRWNYPKFNTEEIIINGINYPIPGNPETFLDNNFGVDWRISKVMWDSLIHCPNIPDNCLNGKMYICLKKQFEELKNGNLNKSEMYKKYIAEELKI